MNEREAWLKQPDDRMRELYAEQQREQDRLDERWSLFVRDFISLAKPFIAALATADHDPGDEDRSGR